MFEAQSPLKNRTLTGKYFLKTRLLGGYTVMIKVLYDTANDTQHAVWEEADIEDLVEMGITAL